MATWFVLDAVARASAIWLAAWAVTRGLRWSGSAAARHRAWTWASTGVLVAPLLGGIGPGWRVPILPASPAYAPAVVAINPDPIGRPLPAPAVPARGAPMSADRPINPLPFAVFAAPTPIIRPIRISFALGTLGGAWVIGFLAVLAPTIAAMARPGRLGGSSRVDDRAWLDLVDELRGELGVGRRVELRFGGGGEVPLTWGVFRPVVLLPDEAAGWPATARRLVLLHELAHVARRDVAALLLGRVVAAVYWFHPLAWLALARLRAECEHAADDMVLAAGVRPSAYAGQLLALARSSRVPRPPLALAMARPHTLEQRMVALFDESRSHAALPARAARRLGLAALALIAFLGTVHPGPATARPGPVPPVPAAPPSLDPPPSPAQAPPAGPLGRIEGTVVRDADGQVVADAAVHLLGPPPRGRTIRSYQLFPRSTRADARGGFAFADLQPGDYQVWATSGDLSSRERMLGAAVKVPAAGPVELRLKPGATVVATVRDRATGQPIAGATVHFRYGGFGPEFRTDDAGRVAARPLTRELWSTEAWADGYAKLVRPIDLEAKADEQAEFLLELGGGIAGTVRDPDGRPVAGVGLSLTSPETRQQVAYIESGRDGAYRLDYLPADANLRLNVRHMDYLVFEEPIRVARGMRAVDLTITPRPDGGSVAGVVLGPDGRPVADAAVSNVGDYSADVRETKTGPDGRYVLRSLFASRSTGKEIFVRASGLAPRRLQVEVGPPDRPGVADVTLEPGHQLVGRAVDAAGRPLAGVTIFLKNSTLRRGSEGSRLTGDDGVFRFDSLPDPVAEPTRIDLLKEGFSDARDRVATLDTAQPADVVLDSEGIVAGRVGDAATGRPIPAFRVRRTFSRVKPNAPNSWLSGASDAPGFPFESTEGRFALKKQVAGMTLQVTVSAEGYEDAVVDPVVVAKASDPAAVTGFALQPIDPRTLTRYAGRLHDGAGLPAAGVEVRLIARKPVATIGRDLFRPAEPVPSWNVLRDGQLGDYPGVVRFLKATTDDRGRFEFAAVPRQARVELFWWGGGVSPDTRAGLERLDEGARAAVDVEVAPPARLVLTVDRGKYPTAARIEVNGQTAGIYEYTSKPVPEDGAAVEITDLPAGPYSIRLTPPFQVDPKTPNGLLTPKDLATATVQLVAGATARVRFGKEE